MMEQTPGISAKVVGWDERHAEGNSWWVMVVEYDETKQPIEVEVNAEYRKANESAESAVLHKHPRNGKLRTIDRPDNRIVGFRVGGIVLLIVGIGSFFLVLATS